MAETPPPTSSRNSMFQWIGSGLILLIVLIILFPAIHPRRMTGEYVSADLQKSRMIALMMFQYANDHNGLYPTGQSSTEVFQKLINDNYCSDPTYFWDGLRKIPGKIKPTSNKLRPENVCWDVTTPLDASSSDYLPVIFSTGYKITYIPNGSAVPLSKPYSEEPHIAVTYHSNSACYMVNHLPDGTITNFISSDFDPIGKKYQQLTPDGPLSP